MLARHAALEAARIKTNARGTLHATATAFGAKDAHHGLNAFMQEMDALIAQASDQGEQDGPTPEEIAFFERMERAARANEKTK